MRIKIKNTPITTNEDVVIDRVSFDASTNTLSLNEATVSADNGATESADILVYVKDLTVEISNNNTINGQIISKYDNDNSGSSIHFKKVGSDATTLSITSEWKPIYGFAECTWGDGLYVSAKDEQGNPIESVVYYSGKEFVSNGSSDISTILFTEESTSTAKLWIGNKVLTESSDDVFSDNEDLKGKVKFISDGTSNTLILDAVSLESTIISSQSLTVSFKGSCYVGNIISTNASATLTFGLADGASDKTDNYICKNDEERWWQGFYGNPTFNDKLVYLPNADTQYIEVLQAPTMSYSSSDSDSKVTLSGLSHDNTHQFSYYYAITYADNVGNISKTKKTLTRVEPNPATNSDDITITHTPFTVEASVVYEDQFGNTTESETAIGKYFGFAEPMILTTLASNTEEKELVLPEILPAIEESDEVNIVFEFSPTDESIIYKNDDSKWMIKGYGSASVEASFGPSDTTPFTILNEVASLDVIVLHEPTFTAYYGDDETKEYDGNGSGNVSVEISSSDLNDLSGYTLMYYLGTDNTTPTPYKDPISLNATTTVNAFIRYVNPANSSITYDSEPVSMEYLVSQKLDTPAFEGSINFQTCYLKDYSLAKPAGLKVYIITEISLTDNTLKAVSIDYIPKGVPVLLEKEGETPEGGYVAATYTGEVGEFSNNMLQYAEDDKDVTDTEFVLFNNEFVKATGIIAAGHCYLSLDGPHANTRGFSIDTSGNGTTGINHASLHDSREVMTKQWYDLQGRKIQKPTKAGLYIVNGKKVVIK